MPQEPGAQAKHDVASARLKELLAQATSFRDLDSEQQLAAARSAADLAHELGNSEAALRAVSLATEAAGRLMLIEDTVTLGHSALAAAGLTVDDEPQHWDEALGRLGRDTVSLLLSAVSALAVAAFRMSDYVESLRFAQIEAHIARHLDDEVREAQAHIGLGWGYDKMGLFTHALEHHFRSLQALERLRPDLVAGPLNGIAAAYLDIGRPDLTIDYARRALAAAPNVGATARNHNTAHRLIGLGHQAKGEVEEARAHFAAALETSDAYSRSLVLLSLGELNLELGDNDSALDYFKEALSLHQLGPRRRAACAAQVGMGKALLAKGEPRQAVAHLEEAIAHGEMSRAPMETAAAHFALASALRQLGRHEAALEQFEAYHYLSERVLKDKSDLRSQVLTIQFDVERLQKDREIDRLRNVELAKAYADLRELHEQLGRQAAKLERLSRTDDLTSLANRRAFEERCEAEATRSRRSGRPLSLLLIDLDDFKRVNDERSHAVGDEVLRATARALAEGSRDVDLSARIGGEEFVVVMPETALENAAMVGEKLIRRVHERVLFDVGIDLTASAGVACLRDGETPSELLARADLLLYQAKREGKNRVRS